MKLFLQTPIKPLSLGRGLLFALAAVGSFHLAYLFTACSWFIFIYLYCLFRLAWLATGRQAFYFGLAVGLAAYAGGPSGCGIFRSGHYRIRLVSDC